MKTEKKIEDYLHLYLGCDAKFEDQSGATVIIPITYGALMKIGNWEITPILRPLSDMTVDNATELCKIETPQERLNDVEVFEIKADHIWYCDGSQDTGDGYSETRDLYIEYNHLTPNQTLWLLKQGFDLFGLIESGLAIDKALNI